MKEQLTGGVSVEGTPNHFFSAETAQIDTFHFAAEGVCLTNAWSTVLSKHLLVFLINFVHRQVCGSVFALCCFPSPSWTVLCQFLKTCLWLNHTFYCFEQCSGDPWPLICVKFTCFMGRGSANMLHLGFKEKTFIHCLVGFYYACKQVGCFMFNFFTGCMGLPLGEKNGKAVWLIFILWLMTGFQSPKQWLQCDILFLLKPNSSKSSSIYTVIY